jgi:hypothetical protein
VIEALNEVLTAIKQYFVYHEMCENTTEVAEPRAPRPPTALQVSTSPPEAALQPP